MVLLRRYCLWFFSFSNGLLCSAAKKRREALCFRISAFAGRPGEKLFLYDTIKFSGEAWLEFKILTMIYVRPQHLSPEDSLAGLTGIKCFVFMVLY
jgi:hypothetical protein